jgi:UDP:flavonoid glycosyltransferase YjiC (YdhE family)
MELLMGASLWFYLEDLATGYPMPLMPNTLAVGDIAVGRFIRPFSDPLDQFMKANSTVGVVVVSFGSFFDFVPEHITTKFCDSFRRIHSRGLRVVWKLKSNESEHGCSSENVMILPWIPQYDLLADTRVRLFISHGGLNSLVESVYHAKPLIIFPIAFDQPANAVAAESKGYAIRMNIAEFTSDELVANIDKILNNTTYQENAKMASRILRDKPDTAAERVGRMIEHVIKYGDRHLRTGAFDLSPMQFMMLDIFAVIFLTVIALASGITGVAYWTLKKFRGGYKRIISISVSRRRKQL